jgi:K+ transporter
MLTTSEPTSSVSAWGGRQTASIALAIGAVGVVFGDIGTSPIYTVQTIFNPDDPHPVPITTGITGVTACFGYRETPDVPDVLRQLEPTETEGSIAIDDASYFLSKAELTKPGYQLRPRGGRISLSPCPT